MGGGRVGEAVAVLVEVEVVVEALQYLIAVYFDHRGMPLESRWFC